MHPEGHAEARAYQILRQFGIDSPPIPVDRLVKKIGLKLDSTELGEDISGVLVVEKGRGVIGVNSTHSRLRQRFSIAHELGHFVLHSAHSPVFIDKTYLAYRDGRSSTGENRREREANAFAAALLMPHKLVRKIVDRQKFDLADDAYVETLANLFEVSKQAMTIRIVNLRLLSG
jgi:Zn-dependent peptidase ImmA (M78 family)